MSESDVIVSADSHVLEPPDLWEKALGARFGDRVPRVVNGFEGHEGSFFYVGRPGEAARMDELVDANQTDRRLDDLARAGRDPVRRLELMDSDGIAAEVINPTWGLWIPRIRDSEVRQACAEVYNDWVAEYASEDLRRLVAVAMIPVEDVDWAIKELHRIVRKGLRGVMIGAQPLEDAKPYRDPVYDPFWAAAQEAGLPVTLHIVTGRARDPFTCHGSDERAEVPRMFIELFGEAAPVLANEFIFGGIFDRFPRLKVLLSEFDASWLPILKYRVNRIQRFPGLRKLAKSPASRYVDENIYVGMINDPLVHKLRYDIGVDRIMWGSDFPHPPCPYPNTTQNVAKLFNGVPDDERRKMIAGNAIELYGIGI
ncbi:MAG: amidohydrolase family protein [Arenicellales bacterium]